MQESDKDRIIERYNARFAEYADDIRTLASGTQERRQLRLQILSEVGLESGASVLDLGCGFGDLYAYLKSRGLDCKYTGYDINPQLIQVARRKFPEVHF